MTFGKYSRCNERIHWKNVMEGNTLNEIAIFVLNVSSVSWHGNAIIVCTCRSISFLTHVMRNTNRVFCWDQIQSPWAHFIEKTFCFDQAASPLVFITVPVDNICRQSSSSFLWATNWASGTHQLNFRRNNLKGFLISLTSSNTLVAQIHNSSVLPFYQALPVPDLLIVGFDFKWIVTQWLCVWFPIERWEVRFQPPHDFSSLVCHWLVTVKPLRSRKAPFVDDLVTSFAIGLMVPPRRSNFKMALLSLLPLIVMSTILYLLPLV